MSISGCCWGGVRERSLLVDLVLRTLAVVGVEGGVALLAASEEGAEVLVQVSQQLANWELVKVGRVKMR